MVGYEINRIYDIALAGLYFKSGVDGFAEATRVQLFKHRSYVEPTPPIKKISK